MKKNVGSVDRVIRVIVGLVLLGWGAATANLWGAVGIIPLFTAAIGWCPAYLPFGIKTCKTE
ncbi:MAG: DUF2892 domain-containing protein [Sedimenticola sp.]